MRATINLNDSVIIRLNPSGVIAFNSLHEKLGLDPEQYHKMYRQPDGSYKMQLWVVMQHFGAEMSMGFNCPIETTIELI